MSDDDFTKEELKYATLLFPEDVAHLVRKEAALEREVALLRVRVECSATCKFTPGGSHTGECLLRAGRKLGEP